MAAQEKPTDDEIARVMRHIGSSRSAIWPKVAAAGPWIKYVWAGTVFVFMAGVTFAVKSEAIVMAADFDPVKKTANHQQEHLIPSMEKRISKLELAIAAASTGVGDLRSQLGAIASTLHRIDRDQRSISKRTATAALCSMHRDTYVAKLADYAAKVRKKPPEHSPAYKHCMASLQTQLHGGD